MNPIQILSASAGSGKTYRLVAILEQEIAAGRVRPEAVLATTFTVKAAAELRERVRARLLEQGQAEAAQRLGAARIGTVNSVCGRLLSDFAFDLGLSPEPRVLDEEAASRAFDRALSTIVLGRTHGEAADGDDAGEAVADLGALPASKAGAALAELRERWHELDWLAAVREIVSRARLNRIDCEALPECARRSVEAFFALLPAPASDGASLERELAAALRDFVAGVDADTTQATRDALQVGTRALARLRGGRPLTWWEWARLANTSTGKASREIYEPVRSAALDHARHPQLREDVRRCIELVFQVAGQALEAYESYKRAWGLVDFVDQEVMALELLRMPHVREQLGEQLDLVLVDEFQDTSPIQLELFLALAGLAKRSVWVGDQKQAIYGFRDTDPALMDAAIEGIVQRFGDGGFETLKYSWRSRPELVDLSSQVFAAAFEAHGVPRDRVLLEAKRAEDGPALGPVVERWNLQSKNQPGDAAALAATVRAFLADPDARVEDVVERAPRPPQPRDLAVLCQTWQVAGLVADALQRAGIPAVLPRKGLLVTPEARVVLAGLRLWVDPRESLAAAELGRSLEHPADGDAWLATILATPGAAYRDLPAVQRIAAANASRPAAGPMEAFDAVLEALGAAELCLRWGGAAQRLANLEQLRAITGTYIETCRSEGMGCTVAGLVTHLRELAAVDDDRQALLSGGNAVTVIIYHGAKGLEWPVTVLYQLDRLREASALGVRVVSDASAFDLAAPLAGRWIRYWPDPFAPQGRTPFHAALAASDAHERVSRDDRRERLRLLYVGWTRARDRLVLAARTGKVMGGLLSLLVDDAGRELVGEPGAATTWAGRPVHVHVREAAPGVELPAAPQAGEGYLAAGPQEHAPAWVEPSRLARVATLGPARTIGAALPVVGRPEWTALGSACHAFFAADRPGTSAAERLALARAALERWGVQGTLAPEALAGAGAALSAWVSARPLPSAWHREWPVHRRLEGGSELVGAADLVLEDDGGLTLVDHKCLAGSLDDALRAAAGYGGQLAAYAEALEAATGKPVRERLVHLVLQGAIVAIGV
jgi:ATP-dependent helicase/nuclease subunit A